MRASVGSMTTTGGPRGVLLTADRIITLGRGRYRARALIIRGTKVIWVGDDPDQAPPHAERRDFDGCVIGPAFVDAHVHLTPTGISLLALDLHGVTTAADLLLAVNTYAQAHPGRVIWGHGFEPHDFVDPLPGPRELTEAASGQAVYLSRRDGHSCLVDEETLSAAPLARAEGVERDGEGQPTGILRREANKIARRWAVGAMTEAELSQARQAVMARAAALGIASVHEMGGPDAMGAADFDAWREGRWPIEVVPYWGSMDTHFVVERDLRQIGGDIWLDGSFGSHTAALDAPYADDPTTSGHLEYDDAQVIEFFAEATNAGLQVAVHVIGDRAVRQAVSAWQKVGSHLPEHLEGQLGRLRHRLEHAELIPRELRPDLAEMGLMISAQPAFETAWNHPGGMYPTRLGEERAALTNPLRELADLGVRLALGSDSNVTPMDPWAGVVAAQHRRHDQHALSRLEAVSSHTIGGRTAARQERFVGVLRAGMRADLTVWEGDPFLAEDPRGSTCHLTLVRGRVAHGDVPLPHWNE